MQRLDFYLDELMRELREGYCPDDPKPPTPAWLAPKPDYYGKVSVWPEPDVRPRQNTRGG